MTKEQRNLEFRVQRADMSSSGDMSVSGYVNMTNQLSHELGFTDKFVEKISPGAFTRAINRSVNNGNDIDFLAEHDDSLVLASTKNGTLSLSEDETGLYMEARIINTSTGRDYYEMIKSGIITNMSFGFYAVEDDWRAVRSDLYERTVNELELFEVSAVRRPAYAASTISNRGLNFSDETVPEYAKEDVVMEQRSNEELLLDAINGLTDEVRELRATMKKKETKEEDDKKLGDNNKDEKNTGSAEVEDKVDKNASEKDAEKKQEQEDKKDEKVEKENSEEKDVEKKDDKDVNEDDVEKSKDDEKEIGKDDDKDKDKKKKNKVDDKKMSGRSYSLFREEFNELRGGTE